MERELLTRWFPWESWGRRAPWYSGPHVKHQSLKVFSEFVVFFCWAFSVQHGVSGLRGSEAFEVLGIWISGCVCTKCFRM